MSMIFPLIGSSSATRIWRFLALGGLALTAGLFGPPDNNSVGVRGCNSALGEPCVCSYGILTDLVGVFGLLTDASRGIPKPRDVPDKPIESNSQSLSDL